MSAPGAGALIGTPEPSGAGRDIQIPRGCPDVPLLEWAFSCLSAGRDIPIFEACPDVPPGRRAPLGCIGPAVDREPKQSVVVARTGIHAGRRKRLDLAGNPTYIQARSAVLEFLYARHKAPALQAAE